MQVLTDRPSELSDWHCILIALWVSPSRKGGGRVEKYERKNAGSSGNELRYSEGRNPDAVFAAFLGCDK